MGLRGLRLWFRGLGFRGPEVQYSDPSNAAPAARIASTPRTACVEGQADFFE